MLDDNNRTITIIQDNTYSSYIKITPYPEGFKIEQHNDFIIVDNSSIDELIKFLQERKTII